MGLQLLLTMVESCLHNCAQDVGRRYYSITKFEDIEHAKDLRTIFVYPLLHGRHQPAFKTM